MQQQIKPSQQAAAIKDTLMQRFAARGELTHRIEQIDREIAVLKSTLEGTELGVQMVNEKIEDAKTRAATAAAAKSAEGAPTP